MSETHCIVVGASHAGTTLALQLRREGWQGPITLIGAEAELPYHRPPLSKEFLSGAKQLEAMRLRPAKAFADADIELMLGNTVLSIDTQQQSLQLHEGPTLNYDRLALCVGSSVRKLALGPDLDNVFYLRTAADAGLLRERLEPGKQAVVIGAGYIGLEVASVMRQMDMPVTVIEAEERTLPRVTAEPVSDFVREMHSAAGVEFRFTSRVSAIQGENQVHSVVCSNGDEIPADIVVLGVGIEPNTRLAETAGLTILDGIQVNEYTQTSDASIVAAGDCTSHPSLLYGRPLRLESVQNANDQARAAAANLCGKPTVYDAVPWFWSDQYDVKLQSVGLIEGHDQIVFRGDHRDLDARSFAAFYLRNGQVIAADCIARPKEFMAAKQLVKNRMEPDPALLADETVEPASWLG
ncbi:MAG: FAD-dependent oxidoreductase [Pseudohongiellaceae bacterium]|jgi:3-phenylpropionate/trans-cinnamate dioxygenase ferredoxin reductase subunit